jgi:hypothetical protein
MLASNPVCVNYWQDWREISVNSYRFSVFGFRFSVEVEVEVEVEVAGLDRTIHNAVSNILGNGRASE